MEETYKELINKLEIWTEAYDKGKPLISDKEWDDYYFQACDMAKELGKEIPIFFKTVSKLEKVEHNHPMLSLAKTKSIDEVISFCGDKECIGMLKMDGLTCSLRYENGYLVSAETRGNGYIGENITHNARMVKNIPQVINYKLPLTVDGEIICTYKDFEPFVAEYKNPRNFASGSIRLLDAKESYNRHLSFIAWDTFNVIEYDKTLNDKLAFLCQQGFTTVPHINFDKGPREMYDDVIADLKKDAVDLSYPIDGLVFKCLICSFIICGSKIHLNTSSYTFSE